MSRKREPHTSDTADPLAAANQLNIDRVPGKSNEQLMTELARSPLVRNTMCAKSYASPSFSGDPPQLNAALEVVTGIAGDVREGNLTKLTDMLAAQAITLDAIFTEYSRRSLSNAGEYLGASQSYATVALKAQANCRTTVEALAKIKRGGKQTVKVVHVHEGAQAVVADTFNQGVQVENQANNPMQRLPMHLSPRCRARTRRGTECLSPAMRNGRCRMHGGKGPGAPLGNQNAYKHGARSAETMAATALVKAMARLCREIE